MKNIISPVDWFNTIEEKAKEYVKDQNDIELLKPETYDLIYAGYDYARMDPQGIYGDYVTVEAFQALASRFILAMELISIMEQNQDIPDL